MRTAVGEHGPPQRRHDRCERKRAEGERQDEGLDDRHRIIRMAQVAIRPARNHRRSRQRKDAVSPEAPERKDHPITHELEREIVDDEWPENWRIGRNEEEQRRDPRKMRRCHHRIKAAPNLVRAKGDQRPGVARRVELFQAALSEQHNRRNLRAADEVENRHAQLRARPRGNRPRILVRRQPSDAGRLRLP